jgi:cobalt-zinc-cadmium efflux system membrane fusion protein
MEAYRYLILGVASILLCATRAAHAHEGHAPLPTKGVQIDVEKGLATLSADAREALGVSTAEVVEGAVPERVMAYARVAVPWQRHHFITSTLPGRIATLQAKPGEKVQRGQVLAEVKSPALDELQTELLTAVNNLGLSTSKLERTTGLAQAEVVAGRDLTEAISINRQNQYAVEIARSKLESVGFSTGQLEALTNRGETVRALPIVSPIDGLIIHSDLMVGKVVRPAEHLFEVVNLAEVDLLVDVLEADLHRVKLGQVVEFVSTSNLETAFRGKVAIKEPYIDDTTHVGRIWVRLKNDDAQAPLLPGMYGQAQLIVSDNTEHPLVPDASLLTNGTEQYVLVEAASTSRASEFVKRNVHVGRRGEGRAEILAGEVYPGDQVVTTGAHVLSNFFVQGVLRLSPQAALNMGLQVAPAEMRPLDDIIEVDGLVDLPPEKRAAASSQLSGTIEKILIDRGQTVVAGDVIAEVASLEFQETQLQLLKAHFEANMLADQLDRYRKLEANQIISQSQRQQADASYKDAVFRRDAAKRTLLTMGLTESQLKSLVDDQRLIDSLPVRAPISGVVVGFEKALGQAIDAEEPLFEIHDLSTVWVRAHLSERDLADVQLGTPARVRLLAEPDFIGEGKVVRSSGILGFDDRTLSVWVELDDADPSEAYHNMLARISFQRARSGPALALPLSAIVSQGTLNYVFLERPDGVFVRKNVELGRRDDSYVEIRHGIAAGDRVAVRGADKLQTAYASIR